MADQTRSGADARPRVHMTERPDLDVIRDLGAAIDDRACVRADHVCRSLLASRLDSTVCVQAASPRAGSTGDARFARAVPLRFARLLPIDDAREQLTLSTQRPVDARLTLQLPHIG